MNRERITTFSVLGFIIISLGVSAYTLFQQSIRLDEAQSLWASTKSLTAIIQYISLDVHVPLYEILLHFWLLIFGFSITSARALSFLFFLATLPLLYSITKESSNKIIALLTIAIYSLSPFIIWYSFEARMYTLFTFVVCLSHYFFLQLVRTSGRRGEVGYFFSTLFGLYTHYFFILLIFTQVFFLVTKLVTDYRRQKLPYSLMSYLKDKKGMISKFFVPLFIAGILFIPWLVYFESRGLASNTQPLIPEVSTYNLFQTVVNFLFGFQPQVIQSLLVALWPLAVVPLFFLFTKRAHKMELSNVLYFVMVTILPIIIVFLVSYYKPIFLARYLIFVTPTFFLLLSWMLFHISKQASVFVISLFALTMFSALLFQNISNATPVKENYEGVAGYLNAHATASDIVAISSPFTIYPIEYYYKGNAPIETIPEWDVYTSGAIPSYSTKNLAQEIKKNATTYQNVFIVLSYDQGYQKDIEHYLDTHYQRLYLKTFSPGLEVREYKLRYPAKSTSS